MASTDHEPNAVQVSTTADGITTITLSREHRRNAVGQYKGHVKTSSNVSLTSGFFSTLDGPTARKLYEAVISFENDPNQKVCVLYGDHGSFCAGFDLHELSTKNDSSETKGYDGPIVNPEHRVQERNIGPMGPSRLIPKKPVISAVAGYAVAGGLELSLIGDMRVVEEDAVFGVFCRRWGVPLIDGGTVRLRAIIGLGRALDLILTGRAVDAREAYAMGLANRVVPKGKALEEATRLARSLLGFPQACMIVDRASCYYAAYDAASFEDALRNEFETGVKVVSTESVKGAARFSKGAGRHGSFKL